MDAMEPRYAALKLLLDELDVNARPRTFADRKGLQKAVYLGQRAALDLGYRFGWYIKGPYSPGLASDSFALKESLDSGDRGWRKYVLDRTTSQRLRRLRTLLMPPRKLNLAQPDWMELVASVHYLRMVARKPASEARKVLRSEKPTLARFYPSAIQALSRHKLTR
jgi:hypothetical protein